MFLDASFGSRSSSSFDWERLFAGYVWDADVQWYAIRHRVYVVGLGWVQRDPRQSSCCNLYAYVSSYPTAFVDPSGEGPPPDESKCLERYQRCMGSTLTSITECMSNCALGNDLLAALLCLISGTVLCARYWPYAMQACIGSVAAICFGGVAVVFLYVFIQCYRLNKQQAEVCDQVLQFCLDHPDVP